MRVFIIESNYPSDFYEGKLDGAALKDVLTLMGIDVTLKYVLDIEHFGKAVTECCEGNFDILHISSHGDENGIALADNRCPNWQVFAQYFSKQNSCPDALIMAVCCGAASGIGEAMARVENGPEIIFGSTKSLKYVDYLVAWSILYRSFLKFRITKKAARLAMQQITAVIHQSFVYRRWDISRGKYLSYPPKNIKYVISEA